MWRDVRTVFADLADVEGGRWAEVPVEALLTLGDAHSAIEAVWDELASDSRPGLKTLLRLAQLRYVTATIGDPFVLAPIVSVTFCGDRGFGQTDRYSSRGGVGETIRGLVLAWLRGMARDGRTPDRLRQDVRDRILASDPVPYAEFAVEALAMLGPDLDDDTEQWLRRVASDDPHRLHPAVESFAVALSLSEVRPQLLTDLSESYYIERPEPEDDTWNGSGLLEDGIRDLHHGLGVGAPFAAWYYGPFFRLLNAVPVETLAMINRMLDHAATARGARAQRRWGGDLDDPDEIVDGVDLDIPGIGPRHYVGDAHVWGWYRGSTVGPYPCMSALLAVERFADHLISTLDIPPGPIVQLLLRDCHNLAMPALIVGLLVRHLDKAGDLLDSWLTHPVVWGLEAGRVTGEGHLHVQSRDDDDVVGRDRRRLTPRDVAAEMTLRAKLSGDEPRLDALGAVADRLLVGGRADIEGDADPGDRLAVVEGWASVFRPENYHARRAPDGAVVMQYEPPEPVATALAPTTADLQVGNEALRLQLTYSDSGDRADGWPTEALLNDIALARQLAVEPPVRGPLYPEDPVAAVAAAAVISHATGRICVHDDDLQWAAATVLTAAMHPRIDFMSSPSTGYPMAADRSAAKAVPSLLLAPFDHLHLDQTPINDALIALATSVYDEVRTALVAGCKGLWAAPCTPGTCPRHGAPWAAVQAGLGDCRVGPWNKEAQRRLPEHLPPPYSKTLGAVPPTDLLVNRLALPIACAADARAAACISSEAAALLEVLLDAHRRGTDHWMTKGYGGYEDPQRELVARVLIDLTVNGEPFSLVAHMETFAGNAKALHQMLHDFAILFTYNQELRRALPTVWPVVLQTTLDAIEGGADLHGNHHWADYALGVLLPTPKLRAADPHPDNTLEKARVDWLAPEALSDLFDRWIALATGEPKAADAVAQYARTTSSAWQPTTGLTWLERIINNRYDDFANRCWFVMNWLTGLREATTLASEPLSQWRRIVDGLAGAGDSHAVDLQRIDE